MEPFAMTSLQGQPLYITVDVEKLRDFVENGLSHQDVVVLH
jgi:hypothetical protein